MPDIDILIEQAETFVKSQTGNCLSDLQRIILAEALSDNPKRKTYDQIATEIGYSGKYVKQVVAPQMWQLLSNAAGQRIQKSNVRTVFTSILESTPNSINTVPALEDDRAPRAFPGLPEEDGVEPTLTVPIVVSPEPFFETVVGRDEDIDNDQRPAEPFSKKAVILLVDDQPQNLALLSDMLENEGYEVRQAISGALALRVATSHSPDIILLDVNMPGMDGYEVCRQLKANAQTETIPVIFVSALHETWDKVKAFSVGGDDYITKPVKVMEVIARIENQLKIRRSQHQLYCLNKQLKYTQHILDGLGLLDPVLGIANRTHFDSMIQAHWQQSLQTQQSLSLILCHIEPAGREYTLAEADAADPLSDPNAPLYWPLLVQVILGEVDHHSPIVGTYDISTPVLSGQGTIAILLTQTDLTQRQAIAQAIDESLQSYLEAMVLTVKLGGSSVIPDSMGEWHQLTAMAEQALHQPSEIRS
ncbi:MAG: response regulator [Cyanobacteria bacterium P01_F01_bin.150]